MRILSRNRRALEPYFPELETAALESLPESCSLDGELLALRDGKPEAVSEVAARLPLFVLGRSRWLAREVRGCGLALSRGKGSAKRLPAAVRLRSSHRLEQERGSSVDALDASEWAIRDP
jgi:hypothetical protein